MYAHTCTYLHTEKQALMYSCKSMYTYWVKYLHPIKHTAMYFQSSLYTCMHIYLHIRKQAYWFLHYNNTHTHTNILIFKHDILQNNVENIRKFENAIKFLFFLLFYLCVCVEYVGVCMVGVCRHVYAFNYIENEIEIVEVCCL